MTAFILLLGALQVLDYVTTRYAIECLKQREGNPLLARLFILYGMRRVLVVKGVMMVAAGVVYPEHVGWMCLPFMIAVGNNLAIIYRKT